MATSQPSYLTPYPSGAAARTNSQDPSEHLVIRVTSHRRPQVKVCQAQGNSHRLQAIDQRAARAADTAATGTSTWREASSPDSKRLTQPNWPTTGLTLLTTSKETDSSRSLTLTASASSLPDPPIDIVIDWDQSTKTALMVQWSVSQRQRKQSPSRSMSCQA